MPFADPLLPVNLVLTGKRCLVVGGGRVAADRVASLLECGAAVRVVAREVGEHVRSLDGVEIHEREFEAADAAGHWLVVAATDDPTVNQQVHDACEAEGIWVNSVDDPDRCTFVTPARIRRGDLVVSVSTSGRSPALASWLRRRLEVELGPEYEVLLGILADERAERRAAGQSTERLDWQSALESGMLDLIREGRLAEAKERLQTCLSSSSG